MTLSEIETVANAVLRDILGDTGFEWAKVEPFIDHAGDKALRVEAHFGPGTAPSPDRPSVRAMGALHGALLDREEERFPYVYFVYPDDEIIGDEDEVEVDQR